MGRKACREQTMKLLYQLELQKEDREEQIQRYFEENADTCDDRNYMMDILDGVDKKKEHIDMLVEKYSKGWKLTRISKIDLAILRLAIYEINERDDIPNSVSINEAVELAKKYSGEEAGAFINGILGKIATVKVVD